MYDHFSINVLPNGNSSFESAQEKKKEKNSEKCVRAIIYVSAHIHFNGGMKIDPLFKKV